MTDDNKLIAKVIRFCKTNCEYFRKEEMLWSIPVDHGFFLTIEETHPEGLSKASHDHREEMIAFWTEEAVRRFGNE
jgi:hypothetical protein